MCAWLVKSTSTKFHDAIYVLCLILSPALAAPFHFRFHAAPTLAALSAARPALHFAPKSTVLRSGLLGASQEPRQSGDVVGTKKPTTLPSSHPHSLKGVGEESGRRARSLKEYS